MARKASKKTAPKKSPAPKKSAKKSSPKAKASKAKAPKSKPAATKKSSAKSRTSGPFPVTTGKGLDPGSIGMALVSHINTGNGDDTTLWEAHFHKDFTSTEGFGMCLQWRGRQAVYDKSAAWIAQHRVHGASAEGPFVGATGFAVRFKMDVEIIATGARMTMEEVGVYTVKDGKVVAEEFMYKV